MRIVPDWVIGLLRTGAEVVGIPGRKVDAMRPNEAMSAAEAKRQRKLAKNRLTNAKS